MSQLGGLRTNARKATLSPLAIATLSPRDGYSPVRRGALPVLQLVNTRGVGPASFPREVGNLGYFLGSCRKGSAACLGRT